MITFTINMKNSVVKAGIITNLNPSVFIFL